jgi:aspartyl-tRNA(Asn)/glutamyl-tRNA(Gln) amidotransferase subunit B
VAEIIALVEKGELSGKSASQVVEGVINVEGQPAQVIDSRGLTVVSAESALMTVIERAIAEQVLNGHIPAAGALIDAASKDTKGQADAARVREFLLGYLGQAPD